MRKTLHTDNRSDIVKTAVDIAAMISQVIDEGGEILIKEKNGSRSKLFIPGLSK